MENTKSPFGLKSCGAFIREANQNADLFKGRWKDVLENAFELNDDQRAALLNASEEGAKEVQRQFDAAYQHLSKGGKIRTRISTRSDGSHGLKLALVGEEEIITGHSLVCCGADCGDWGVWCPDPPQ